MRYTMREVAEIVGGELHGDPAVVVTDVASLEQAQQADISFATAENLDQAVRSGASALVVPRLVEGFHGPQIVATDPYLAFLNLLRRVEGERQSLPKGIHPSAVVEEGVVLGQGVALGPHVVLCRGARLGARTVLCAGVYVGAESRLGDDCLVHPSVTIRERVRIGHRAIIHSGTTIGGDGFGFQRGEGTAVKVPQVGTVEIGDDVEIGCNCTVARATMDATVIGSGVKMDSHCHIAHNCRIGDNSVLVAYARIGGGTVIGKNVLLAEDVGVTDHVTLGDGCIVAGTAKVLKDIPAGAIVWGTPAQDIRREKRERAAVRRLPEMLEQLRALRRDLEQLKGKP
jgi:UDP-3-O-[3-hydroxymyristoyl] glucosamine N-acyltransferase